MAGVTDPDRCPGVLRPHSAADGAMVRIRVPGGQTTGRALGQLSRIAQQFGSGDLQLTSRASLQIRGLADPAPDGLIRAVRESGFLPSQTHERVRNIVGSPLTGIIGGRTDVRPLIASLDSGLSAEPRLASLPSRFLFAVDDGRGDVSAIPFDLGYQAVDHHHGWVLLGGAERGLCVPARDAAPTLLELAHRFLTASQGFDHVWHVRDLADWATTVPGVRAVKLPRGVTATPLGAAGAADPGSSRNGRGICHRIGCDHTIAGVGVVGSCPSSSGACSRGTRRQPGFAMVGNFGVRRRSFLRELLDQYSRVRDGVGTVRFTAATHPHQWL